MPSMISLPVEVTVRHESVLQDGDRVLLSVNRSMTTTEMEDVLLRLHGEFPSVVFTLIPDSQVLVRKGPTATTEG
jgi:hypothetical protein